MREDGALVVVQPNGALEILPMHPLKDVMHAQYEQLCGTLATVITHPWLEQMCSVSCAFAS